MKLDVIALWRDLHQIPELAFEEVKTSAYIAEKLTQMGYEVTRGIGGTGVLGVKRGVEPGPVMLLRADMDALPFKNPDGSVERVHACGHDSHCAMLLTAAAELIDQVRRGTLKVFFQPAEEVVCGALRSFQDGVMDDVDLALGLHIRPVQDAQAGEMCASVNHTSAVQLRVEIQGQAAHASRPHLGVNAAEAAALVTLAVCAVKLDPGKAWSLKVTGINAMSSAANIISDKGELMLDCRAQTNAIMIELLRKLREAVENAARAVGATAQLIIPEVIVPAAEYDPELTAEVAEEIVKVVGEDKLVAGCGGGGEDFHMYKKLKPELRCAYFGVGVGCEPGLHDRTMHFDPQYLINGVRVLQAMALRHLG